MPPLPQQPQEPALPQVPDWLQQQQPKPAPSSAPSAAPTEQKPQVDWEGAIPGLAQKYGIQPDLIQRVIRAESSGRPDALGPVRTPRGGAPGQAIGLMQLWPTTAKRLGVDPNDPIQNIEGGTRELRRLLEKYQGHYGKAIAAYNGAEALIDQGKHLEELSPETQAYVKSVLEGYEPPQKTQQTPPAAAPPPQQGPQAGQQAQQAPQGFGGDYQHLIPQIWKGLTAPGTLFGPPTQQQTQGIGDLQRGVQESQAWYAQHPEAQQANRGFFPPKGGLQMPPDAAAPHMQAYWQNPTAANLRAIPEEAPFSPIAAGMAQPGTVMGGVAESAAGMASPANIAQLAAVPVDKLINLFYSGQMGIDTAKLLYQAHQLKASGNQKDASELFGQALVAGGMTLLTALGLRPEKTAGTSAGKDTGTGVRPGVREETAQPGVSGGQQPAQTQVAGLQEPSLAQEGGARPVTSPGVSGGREIGGAEPAGVASAPIEGGGHTVGTAEPKPSGPAAGEMQPYTTPEMLQRKVGEARAAGLLPDQRQGPGAPPAGQPERRGVYEIHKENVGPTGGEQLAQQIRESRSGPSVPDEMKGLVMQRIMRDPALYQKFKAADERGQIAIATQIRDQILKEQPSAQGPTRSAQAPAPTSAQPAAQPLQRSVVKPQATSYTTGEPVRPGSEPVREPVRPTEQPVAPATAPTKADTLGAARKAPTKPTYKPYQSLPASERPRVPAYPAAPEAAKPETKPAPQPVSALPAEPRMQPGMKPEQKQEVAAQRDEWLKQRAQTVPTKAALKEGITHMTAAEASATLDRTLTRHLKSTDEARPGRHKELDEAIKREVAKGPEAATAAATAMTRRAEIADGKRKTAEHLLSKPTQEWDKEMREMLHEATPRGEIDPETGKFVPAKTHWLTKEGVFGGRRAKVEYQRNLDAITAEIFNDLRGNKMKEVGTERRLPLDEASQQKLEGRQEAYKELLEDVRKQEGHRPTDEQLAKLRDLMGDIHALRQTRMIAQTGPGSEPLGTAATNKFWNQLMGRPEGSHLGKPSEAQLKIQLEKLRQEAQKAREVASRLRPEGQKALDYSKPAEPGTIAGNTELAAAEHEEKEAAKRAPEAPKGFGKEEDFISKAEKRTDEELGKWWRTPGREYQTLELTKRMQNAPPELKARWNAVKERAQRMFEEIGVREGSIPAPKEAAKAPEKPVEAPKPAPKAEVAKPTPEAPKTAPNAELKTLRKQVAARLQAATEGSPEHAQLKTLLGQIDAKLGPTKAPAAAVKAEAPIKGAGVPTPKMQEAIRREISKPHVERPTEKPAEPKTKGYSTGQKVPERPVEAAKPEVRGPSVQKQITEAFNSGGQKGLEEFTADDLRHAKPYVGAQTQTAIDAELRAREASKSEIAKLAPKQEASVQAPKKDEHVPIQVEPSTGGGGKADITRGQLYDLGQRIDKLPKGEDRNDLASHINKVSRDFEKLSEKIKWTARAIQAMRDSGKTSRTRVVEGRKVTETLEQLENRIRNLGLERMRLVDEHLPGLKDSVAAMEKAPISKAPQQAPTKTEPVRMPTYGPAEVIRDPQTGKYEGTIPGEKTGEKVVVPSPAPKEEGALTKIEQLKQHEKHLEGLYNKYGASPTRSAAITMSQLKKSIKSIRAELGPDAPAMAPNVAAAIEGGKLLEKAKRAEPPVREVTVIKPTEKGYVTGAPRGENAEDLHRWLTSRSEAIPKATLKFIDKALSSAGVAGDHLASPILDALKKGKFGNPESDEAAAKAAARFGYALDTLSKGRVASLAAPEGERNALRAKAFSDAWKIAQSGEPRLGKPFIVPKGEKGFAGGPKLFKEGELDKLAKSAIDRLFGKKAPGQQSKGPGLLDRMRETSDAFKAARMLDDNLEERRFQQQGMRQRFMQGLKNLPKVPGLQKGMYRAAERGEKFEGAVGKVFDEHIRDWADLAEQRYHQLREAGHDVESYVRRVAIKKNTMWDRILRGTGQYSMGSVLKQTADSLKGRRFFRLEAPGLPSDTVVHVASDGALTHWDQGQAFPLGITRKEMEASGAKFGTATSDDITRHSGQEYLQHLYIATATNAMNLDNAWRAHEFLEAYKASPEFVQYATKAGPGDPIPDGFSHTKVPQLQGYAFEKHTADVLNRYYDQLDQSNSSFLDKFNYGLMSTIYWNPLKHARNIIDHWATHHGLSSFLNPTQYRPMAEAFRKAWTAVRTGNNDYLYALDNGMPLRGRMVTNADMTGAILKEANVLPMAKDANGVWRVKPEATGIAKAWGYANPKQMYKNYMNAQRRALFGLDDVLRLQAVYHHQTVSKMPFHESWKEVSKHLPDYTLPTHVGLRVPFTDIDVPSKTLARGFGSKAMIFGRYHYGRLKSYGYMAQDALKSGPLLDKDRLKAIDRLMIPAVGMLIYSTLGAAAAKWMANNPQAEMSPSGATAIPWMIMRMLQGKSTIARTAMSTFTPNPLVDLAARMGYGEMSRPKPIGAQVKEASKGLFGEIGPVREAQQTRKGPGGSIDWAEGARRALFNVYTPKSSASGLPKLPHLTRMPRMPR